MRGRAARPCGSPCTPSPPSGGGVGVRGRIPERLPTPTSPSHRFAMGPSLSPLKGGEGLDRRNGVGGGADRAGEAQGRRGQEETRAAVGAEPVGEVGEEPDL